MDGLKKMVREELQKEYDSVSKMHLKRAILDALAPLCKFDAPETMTKMEFDSIWKQFENAKAQGQLDESEKKAKESDLKKEYEDIAVRRVKLGLLLAEIANQNNIVLSNDDITKAISREAARYPGAEKNVFEYYQKNQRALDALRAQLFKEKVVDFVITQIITQEKKMTSKELYAFDPDKK